MVGSQARGVTCLQTASFVIHRTVDGDNDSDRLWPVDCCSQTGMGGLGFLGRRETAFASPRLGLALGGGFARGIAHAGVLRVFERHGIPLHCITGVSAGSIVAAAYASGTPADDIARIGCSMRFRDVARWSICRMGFMGSDRMK